MAEELSLAKRIRLRHEAFVQHRAQYEPDWYTITEYTNPGRERSDAHNPIEGLRAAARAYDGTPHASCVMMANGFLGYIASPNMNWFRLRWPTEQLEELPQAKEWLEEVENIMYMVYAASTFYAELHAYFMDGGSIGTATISIEEDEKTGQVYFRTEDPWTVWIGVDRWNQVDTVHRVFTLPARVAVKTFPQEKFSRGLLEAAEKTPDKEYKFLHAVWPNDERRWGVLAGVNKKWASVYLELETADDGDVILHRGGFDEMPYAVWRWRTNSWERYGRGPGHDALVDILRLNAISKSVMQRANYDVDPYIEVPDDRKGEVRLKPGGKGLYKDPTRRIFPVELGKYTIGVDREQKLEAAIRQAYMVDFFLMLAQAERQMTAREIIERQGEKAAVMGAVTAQIERTCLNPAMGRTFNLLYRRGKVPPLPEAIRPYLNGQPLKVDYLGPLSQAQRTLFRTQGITRALERIVPLVEIWPEITDIPDVDALVRELMDADGMPSRLVRQPEMVEQRRKARQQAMERQAQVDQQNVAADTAGKLNQPVEQGSLLEAILGARR